MTARGEVEDRIRGLRLGSDDYLAKPFRFEELLARVRAVLRRGSGIARNRLRWDRLCLEPDAHRALWADAEIPLTPGEFQLLEALLLRPGRVLPRTRLILHLHDEAFDSDSNVVDVHMTGLRRELRAAGGGNVVETVRGVGFRLPERPA